MISDELNKLKNTKSAIKTALETPSNDFSSYAELIEKYVNNQPTKKTTGICENAVDLPIKSGGVFGNSLQGENPTPDNPQEIEVVTEVALEHTNADGTLSEIIPINLQGNKLAKVGDIRDKLKISRNGNVEIEKKVEEINSYNNENITTNYISKTGQLTNGTQVYYELAEPTTITLPQIEPIKMWQGTNIFKLISNLDSDIEIEYVVESEAQ